MGRGKLSRKYFVATRITQLALACLWSKFLYMRLKCYFFAPKRDLIRSEMELHWLTANEMLESQIRGLPA